MRRLLAACALIALLLAPLVAAANPPPPGAPGTGSPEPLAALLLLAGAGPAWLVYRRVRRGPLAR